MKNKLLLLILMLSAFSASCFASIENDVNATIVYGTDTNPHELSNIFEPIQQEYAEAEFSVNTNYDRFIYLRAKANKSIYFDDSRADRFDGNTTIALKSKFKIFKRKFKYQFSANYQVKDETFVSKQTGQVATFGGQSIADRYDSEQNNYLAEISYRPYRTANWRFSYQSRNKSYTEYEIDGIDNLDYSHQRYRLDFEYKSSDLGRMFSRLTYIERDYLDRVGRDLAGDDILGSELAYKYQTLDVGYIYRPNKKIRWRYAFNYEYRADNVSGYYDATSGFISIAGRYGFGDYHFITARLKYSRFSFENQRVSTDNNRLDEDAKEKQGGTFTFGYEWIVATLFDTNIALYSEIDLAIFENSIQFYSYDRGRASIGIRWSAF